MTWQPAPRDRTRKGKVYVLSYGTAARRRTLMYAQELESGGLWFIYGMGINTAHAPVETLDQAKAQAEEHARREIAERAALVARQASGGPAPGG